MEPRRIVQSLGASSPARAKWRFAASSRPRWWSRHASARSDRASCASGEGSTWFRRTSSAGSAPLPSFTQARIRSRYGPDALPWKAVNVSVPNWLSFGRTIRPASSIQRIVGTFTT